MTLVADDEDARGGFDDVVGDGLQKTGIFRPSVGTMDGKWFAESAEHAQQWGRLLNKGQGAVVTTRIPTSYADTLMRLGRLDGIGPARYAEDLSEFNKVMNGFKVLP